MSARLSEFDLIRRFFAWPAPAGYTGAGDDCALIPTAAGAQAISTDLLLEHRHFFSDVPPRTLGHKALAVNLSDLAAMGATPRGFVLGLALPSVDEDWLAAFATGMRELADRAGCPLVGGDTTRSPRDLSISVTVFGNVDARRALRRDAARPGDDIWVSGVLGEADVALRLSWLKRGTPGNTPLDQTLAAMPVALRDTLLERILPRLQLPEPRLALGRMLVGRAHACIDVSDGLLQDLGHILAASQCGAQIQADSVPVSPALRDLPPDAARQATLGGGDVYELCFTAAPGQRQFIESLGEQISLQLTRIGTIQERPGLRVGDGQGRELARPAGFDHFA